LSNKIITFDVLYKSLFRQNDRNKKRTKIKKNKKILYQQKATIMVGLVSGVVNIKPCKNQKTTSWKRFKPNESGSSSQATYPDRLRNLQKFSIILK